MLFIQPQQPDYRSAAIIVATTMRLAPESTEYRYGKGDPLTSRSHHSTTTVTAVVNAKRKFLQRLNEETPLMNTEEFRSHRAAGLRNSGVAPTAAQRKRIVCDSQQRLLRTKGPRGRGIMS